MNAPADQIAFKPLPHLRNIGQRLAALCLEHGDINAYSQLHRDMCDLLLLSKKNLPATDYTHLQNGINALESLLQSSSLPDAEQCTSLRKLSALMNASGANEKNANPNPVRNTATITQHSATASTRLESPPQAYWRQWADDAEAPRYTMDGQKTAVAAEEIQALRTEPMSTPPKTPADASALDPSSRNQRIYHLTGYGELAVAIDQLLEREGMSVEQLENETELSELLQALPADLVLIDAEFADKAQSVLAAIAPYRKNAQKPLTLVQICAPGEAEKNSNFDGMDAVIATERDAMAVVGRIDQLLRFGKAEQYKVLIVEDDRSQAMFAEGILRNAEIGSRVLLDADNLLESLNDYCPDLILMDLNMPNTSGIKLTEMIRESSLHQNIPIIFLSGEADEDRQMDAMEAGGDDFLSKPIKPRRLIAAVQNRIKRHRTLSAVMAKPAPAPATVAGLMPRMDLLQLLKKNIRSTEHALLFIELNGVNLLKDRIGLSGLESLLKKFAEYLLQQCKPHPVARFGDGSFAMVYQGDCADNTLSAYASALRAQLMAQKFEINEQLVEFRVHIGVCHFEYAQENADILINAVERTARYARGRPGGISLYKPQASSEVLREEAILARLAKLAENDCLSHVYQPIVAVAGGVEKQYQTLLRFTGEDGEVVSAAEFIPLAERSNLIIELDRWSLTQAIATVVKHKAEDDEIKLFVNQSNVTLLDGEQLAWLKNQLKAHSLHSNALVIEINHNDALLNRQSIKEFCQALVDDGIQFCLSRYNPRNDEPNLLTALPLSYVKLAQGLTADLGSNKTRDDIKVMVDFAHRNGLEVIGHSVEDAQSAATLWMSGIDFIQGNLVQSAAATLEFGFDQSVL